MLKLTHRFVALLLVPILLVDPALAISFNSFLAPRSPPARLISLEWCQSEALANRLAAAYRNLFSATPGIEVSQLRSQSEGGFAFAGMDPGLRPSRKLEIYGLGILAVIGAVIWLLVRRRSVKNLRSVAAPAVQIQKPISREMARLYKSVDMLKQVLNLFDAFYQGRRDAYSRKIIEQVGTYRFYSAAAEDTPAENHVNVLELRRNDVLGTARAENCQVIIGARLSGDRASTAFLLHHWLAKPPWRKTMRGYRAHLQRRAARIRDCFDVLPKQRHDQLVMVSVYREDTQEQVEAIANRLLIAPGMSTVRMLFIEHAAKSEATVVTTQGGIAIRIRQNGQGTISELILPWSKIIPLLRPKPTFEKLSALALIAKLADPHLKAQGAVPKNLFSALLRAA